MKDFVHTYKLKEIVTKIQSREVKFENIQHTERYHLYGNELEYVFEEKNLGVHIDWELKFEEHISYKVNKANALVVLIRRSFS